MFSESDPVKRSLIVNRCVEKGIGKQSILVGHNRSINDQLERLDEKILSKNAKQTIFRELVDVSPEETEQSQAWAVCIFYHPRLFLEQLQSMVPEDRKKIESSLPNLGNLDVAGTEILMKLKKDGFLDISLVSTQAKESGLISLIKAKKPTLPWIHGFESFPDVSWALRNHFAKDLYSNESRMVRIEEAVLLPEELAALLPNKTRAEIATDIIVLVEQPSPEQTRFLQQPHDWVEILIAYIKNMRQTRKRWKKPLFVFQQKSTRTFQKNRPIFLRVFMYLR